MRKIMTEELIVTIDPNSFNDNSLKNSVGDNCPTVIIIFGLYYNPTAF